MHFFNSLVTREILNKGKNHKNCFRWVLPESPRWLLAMGRTNEVMTILQRASSWNKRELPINIDKQLLPCESDSETESVNVMDLFKTRQMRKKTFLLFIIWFSVYLVYYGLVLNLGNIGGDLYINSVNYQKNTFTKISQFFSRFYQVLLKFLQ